MIKMRWEEMLPDEFLAIRDRCPVCYMAYGLAEPHGAYNALGLDWLKAQGLCERAALAHGGIVAPPFCWHVQERPAFDWPRRMGVLQSLCSSIPGDLFLHLVMHNLRVFDAREFHAAILITGHYGGLERDMRLVCDYYRMRSGSPMQIHCISDNECMNYGNYRGDHAGMCETQQLMAIRPELVDLNRAEPSPTSGAWCGTDFKHKGLTPDRAVGENIVASQIESLGQTQRKLLADYKPVAGWTPPDQDMVEDYWRDFDQLTRPFWILSMSWDEYKTGAFRKFPGWSAMGVTAKPA